MFDEELSAEDIYDELATVVDPERGGLTLADLNVVAPDRVKVKYTAKRKAHVEVEILPTVPHCGFMTLIALCVRAKLLECLPVTTKWKVDIYVVPGSHLQGKEIERQVNDKERVAAALENPMLCQQVQKLINPYGDVA